MTNYSLLAQAKLLKMVEEYVALTVRGEKCESFTGGCLVQVTSTNPFEISDSSNHMRVKNPQRILEELKTVNSNINLLSLKGALIFLQKWNFESQYNSTTDELRFDIIIEDVKYMDGIGTADIIMDTVFLLDDASLRKKFKRLKKYLVAQEFNTSHPIENALSIIENAQFHISEMKRKADLKAQMSFHTTLNPFKDPFYVGDNECYPGKASVSKSQLSQGSDFELLSLNSATEARYGSVNIKPSIVKKPYHSLPGPDMFSLNLDLLSSQPLLQKIQIDDDGDNGQEGVKPRARTVKKDDDMLKHIEVMELEEITEEAYGVHKHSQEIQEIEEDADESEEEEEPVEEEVSSEAKEEKNNVASETSEKENVIEEEHRNRGQKKLKRNFHEMIEQNKMSNMEFPHQDLKKGKYQWGLNHRNEQQEFRKQIETRKSLVQVAPETDTLQLLASQFSRKEQSQSPAKENKETVVLQEEEEKSRGLNESMGLNKVYNTTLHPYTKDDEDDDEESEYSNSRGVEQRYNMDHKKKKAELGISQKAQNTQYTQSVQRPVINRRVNTVEAKARESSGSKSREPQKVQNVQRVLPNKQTQNQVVSSGVRVREQEVTVVSQKKIMAASAPVVVENKKKSSVIEIERGTQYRRQTQTDEMINVKKKQNVQERREYTQYRENDLAEDLLEERDREIANKERYIAFGREYKKIDSMASQMARSALQEDKARLANYIDLTREETIQKAKKGVGYYVAPGEKRRQATPNDITNYTNYANYTDLRKVGMSKSVKNKNEVIVEREFKRVENPLDPTKSINISDFRDITIKPKKIGGANGTNGGSVMGSKNLKQSSKKYIEIA